MCKSYYHQKELNYFENEKRKSLLADTSKLANITQIAYFSA
jgi:hypothetical protein